MNDTRSIAIAVLAVSATVLATVLVLSMNATPAMADTPVAGGEYIMVTGAYSSGVDLVYVFDLQQRGVNVYGYDRQNDRIKLMESLELKRVFRK